MTVGIGNGPVNAIDSALRKALVSFYPTLKNLKLTDYKVNIISPEKGTGAITRVIIESTDETKKHWTTIGVSPNINLKKLWDENKNDILLKRAQKIMEDAGVLDMHPKLAADNSA